MNKLNTFQIQQNKEEFINLLMKVKRPGIDNLITWLEEKSDFFTAPSSTIYHGSYEGGLCQHSLNVYKALHKMIDLTKEMALPEKQINDISEETLIVCALLHDLCKTNYYAKEIKTWKDESQPAGFQWRRYYGYKIIDSLPLGHGEKSVMMAQQFIQLSCTEMVAIRWHMGESDPGVAMSVYERPAFTNAVNNYPLSVLLQQADMYASFMMELMCDPKVDNAIE